MVVIKKTYVIQKNKLGFFCDEELRELSKELSDVLKISIEFNSVLCPRGEGLSITIIANTHDDKE
ncbi:MAG TPA: hypothetical protein VK255_03240 [Patescibacteria group bacterium]|nr:hypothetical protein [Patescibacteria group bacterium]